MPTPKKGEGRASYVSRCVTTRKGEHPEEKTKQSVAVCYSMWRQHKKKK